MDENEKAKSFAARNNQYVIRFPDGMRDKIKELAAREGRSMNTQIVKFIELGLKLAA